MMHERAGGIRVHFVEASKNLAEPLLALGCGFGPIHVSSYLRRLLSYRLLLLAGALAPFCGLLASGFHFDDYAISQDAAIRAPNGWLAVWNPAQTRPLT